MKTTLLVRVLNPPRWQRYNDYPNAKAAEQAWRREIQGRGLTAWSWWGPADLAERMLADPNDSGR